MACLMSKLVYETQAAVFHVCAVTSIVCLKILRNDA